ncbi:hypothetical protein [uncultured Helicobacter sp.]|uniref:hypothetical protein n=1 Tax=uncultured Helicobacter sp. TaxID=175537 RepID=UPI00262B5E10|nr:hypothetical protein [uncultured Helicobacter sp.]
MQFAAIVLCVFWAIVAVEARGAESKQECLIQEQIEQKAFVVRVSKEWFDTDKVESMLSRLKSLYPQVIFVRAVSWGNESEILAFEVPVKDVRVIGHKDDKVSVDDWFPNGKGHWDFRINGREILYKEHLPKGSVLAVQSATPGSASIGGVVEFVLENGVKIEHRIQEYPIGTDYFYNAQGELLVECDAIEQ